MATLSSGVRRGTRPSPEADRLTGGDSFLLHLEKLVPMHTLKVLVLDPGARGRAVSLEDVEAAVRRLLPHWPRAGRRLAYAPLHRGRPFLVDDPDFDITSHLDERFLTDQTDQIGLAAPADGAAFDRVLCELANRRLDMNRPLWTATLIHGLAGGRQAVAVALHHALADGMAAITMFTEFTADAPSETAPALRGPAASSDRHMSPEGLVRKAIGDSRGLITGLAPLVRNAWRSRRIAADFRMARDMPKGLLAHRNSLSRRFGTERVCATSSHPLADLKSISKASGASINGVLHAVIADALRREIAGRGEDLNKSLRAGFGIAADAPGTRRLWGNNVSITSISLHTDERDPVQRLHKVSASAKNGLELRRLLGLGVQPAAMSYASRLAPQVVRHAGKVGNIAHVMTANVPGPRRRRWAGDVEVADFFSLAVLVPPIGLNMTAYSYAGKLNIGLLTAPEIHPDPARLLELVDESIVALCEALGLAAADRDNPSSWE